MVRVFWSADISIFSRIGQQLDSGAFCFSCDAFVCFVYFIFWGQIWAWKWSKNRHFVLYEYCNRPSPYPPLLLGLQPLELSYRVLHTKCIFPNKKDRYFERPCSKISGGKVALEIVNRFLALNFLFFVFTFFSDSPAPTPKMPIFWKIRKLPQKIFEKHPVQCQWVLKKDNWWMVRIW